MDYTFFFTECPLGYHSFNCSETCKFPTFGDDCQHICNCSKDLCSHNNGCKISNGMSLQMYACTVLILEFTPIISSIYMY